MNTRNIFLKSFLASVLAFSFVAGIQINQAQAGSSKRAAIIAGAIIGGAIIYHHHKKRKAHKRYRVYGAKRYYKKKHYDYGYYKPRKRTHTRVYHRRYKPSYNGYTPHISPK